MSVPQIDTICGFYFLSRVNLLYNISVYNRFNGNRRFWFIDLKNTGNMKTERLLIAIVFLRASKTRDENDSTRIWILCCHTGWSQICSNLGSFIAETANFRTSHSILIHAEMVHRVLLQENVAGNEKRMNRENFTSKEGSDVSDPEIPDPRNLVPRYGTYRDLTEAQVRDIVARCKAYIDRGGTIASFFRDAERSPSSYTCSTLRDWLLNPKFQ